MASEEILMEIDATLDRLIQNAEAIAGVEIEELSSPSSRFFIRRKRASSTICSTQISGWHRSGKVFPS